ncbi:MAG: 16S rRNA (adenine(1518)-N(6)/adenine(1519)-N(6))-dimethyltransferase RsmA [Planctomycetota bacterium]|jgi:16S rRNA (adenine1518-N6/adenine1519-N6)-dimethyltransferase
MSDAGREPFHVYREKLDALGFRPSKSLGQNFLLDPALNRYLAEALGPEASDLVLEIGPGLGFLTRELASRAGAVLAVELDRRLHALLQEEIAEMPAGDRIELIQGNILAKGGGINPIVLKGLEAALQRSGAQQTLVGANLPYAISGPCLANLACLDSLPARMVFLLQVDVVERFIAEAGSKAYGSLSVLLGSLYHCRMLRRVGSEVFRPRPRVASAVLSMTLREDRDPTLIPVEARVAYGGFLRQAFAARRKKLRGALNLAPAEARASWDLAALGSQGDLRAGEIPVDDWPGLWLRTCSGFP